MSGVVGEEEEEKQNEESKRCHSLVLITITAAAAAEPEAPPRSDPFRFTCAVESPSKTNDRIGCRWLTLNCVQISSDCPCPCPVLWFWSPLHVALRFQLFARMSHIQPQLAIPIHPPTHREDDDKDQNHHQEWRKKKKK